MPARGEFLEPFASAGYTTNGILQIHKMFMKLAPTAETCFAQQKCPHVSLQDIYSLVIVSCVGILFTITTFYFVRNPGLSSRLVFIAVRLLQRQL